MHHKLGQSEESNSNKKSKLKKRVRKKDKNQINDDLKNESDNSQILFSRVEKMKKVNKNDDEDLSDDIILNSDFMKRKEP